MPFIKFLIGVVLFAILPLLGWGVNDMSGFFDEPTRLAYFITVILLQAVILMKWPDAGRQGGKGSRPVRGQRSAIILLQVFSLSLMFVAPYSDRWNLVVLGDVVLLRWIGVAVNAFGFFVMNWSEAALGREFSVHVTLQEGHRLMTDGPFKYIRHPRYAGIVLHGLGLALVFRSGPALLITAAIACVLIWRIHDEEALLREAFGKEWDEYEKRTKRLIPFVC